MKTDREFLDGIYLKAQEIQGDEVKIPKIHHFVTLQKVLAVAAAFMVVAIPSVLFFNQPKMQPPSDYQANAPMSIRAFQAETFDLAELISNSDLIVTGKVTQIKKSVYDEENSSIITSVEVKPTQIIKGKTDTKVLDISVTGGYHKKIDTFIDYEAIFERSEDVLVFLVLDEDSDSYILSQGSQSKYSALESENNAKSYIRVDDATIMVSQLEEIIRKGE